MSATFTAKYRGTCLGCDGQIDPGDLVKWDARDVVHAECPGADAGHDTPKTGLCPECFTYRAVNGACGCHE